MVKSISPPQKGMPAQLPAPPLEAKSGGSLSELRECGVVMFMFHGLSLDVEEPIARGWACPMAALEEELGCEWLAGWGETADEGWQPKAKPLEALAAALPRFATGLKFDALMEEVAVFGRWGDGGPVVAVRFGCGHEFEKRTAAARWAGRASAGMGAWLESLGLPRERVEAQAEVGSPEPTWMDGLERIQKCGRAWASQAALSKAVPPIRGWPPPLFEDLTHGAIMSDAIVRLPCHREWGMAYIAAQAFVAKDVEEWAFSRSVACRLLDFEAAVGSGPLAKLTGVEDGLENTGRWRLAIEQAEKAAYALPKVFSGSEIRCRVSHCGVERALAREGPVVTISLVGAEEFGTAEQAREWTRSARAWLGSWLEGQGVEHAGFELAGDATAEQAAREFEQVHDMGRAWALRDQIKSESGPQGPGASRQAKGPRI